MAALRHFLRPKGLALRTRAIATRRSGRILAGMIVVAVAAPARADRGAADQLAGEAEALAKAGDLAGAAKKFRAAYAEDPRPELICNVGVAYYKAVDLPRAYRYLDQCKDTPAQLDPAFLDGVTKALTAVRERLATGDFSPVQIVVEPPQAATTIEGGPFDEPFVGTHVVYVPFGHYTLVIHAEGYEDKHIGIDATSRAPITATARLARALPPAAELHPIEAHASEPAPPPPPIEHRAPRASRRPAIYASTATAALGVVSLGLYLVARSRADDANTLAAAGTDMTGYRSTVDSAHNFQYASWAGGALTAGGAALSIYLWSGTW